MENEATEVTTLIPKDKKTKRLLIIAAVVLAIIIIIIIIAVLIWYFTTDKSSGGNSNTYPLPKGFSDSVDSLKDPKKRLEALLKLKTTLDEKHTSFTYSVGFVFLRDMMYPALFGALRPLFFYERIASSGVELLDSDYQLLSREFGIYRNITDGTILSSWQNEITGNMTEVFSMERAPWDFNFTTSSPVVDLPYLVQPDGTISMVTEEINQYKSHMDPDDFPGYDFVGHPYFQDAEFSRFYGDLDKLLNDSKLTYPSAGTWSRRSQYLPWMQLGNYTGGLLYSGPLWKINSLGDIPSDMATFANDFNFSSFLQKPKSHMGANKNSWDYFQEVVDKRNASGEPLIQIPPANKTSKYNKFVTKYDRTLDNFMLRLKNETVFLKGRVYSAEQSKDNFGKYLGDIVGYALIHNVTLKPKISPPLFYITMGVAMSYERAKSDGGSREVLHQGSNRGCFHFGGTGSSHYDVPQFLTRTLNGNMFVSSSADGISPLGDSANTLSFQVEGVQSWMMFGKKGTPHFQGSLVRVEKLASWMTSSSVQSEAGDVPEDADSQMMSHIEFVRLKGGLSDVPESIRPELETAFHISETC